MVVDPRPKNARARHPKSAPPLLPPELENALDDGYPYEHIGNEIELRWASAGWVTPTPFMIVELKEIIRELIKIYGRNGHPILREIGRKNLRADLSFIEGLGLASFLSLRAWAANSLPPEQSALLL